MSSKEFLLIIIGGASFLFKGFIYGFISMIGSHLVNSVTVTTNNSEQYAKLNKFLFSLDKKILQNNIESSNVWIMGMATETQSINEGTFIFMIDKLTWCIVTKTLKDTTNGISSIITVSFIGLKRHEKFNDLRKHLVISDPDKIKCYASTNLFDNGKSISKRSFDTVFLKDKDVLINKVVNWSNSKDFYLKHGLNHKLGILLYGEAGTGKSTVGRAIASMLDYNLVYINLRGHVNSGQLTEKLINIPNKTVILLEDVDCVVGNRETNTSFDDVFSTTLNFLDGVLSPEECIIIATTNYIDRLDDAFKREGRFDIKVELGKLDYKEAKEMCDSYGIDINDLDITLPINPSKLLNVLLMRTKNKN